MNSSKENILKKIRAALVETTPVPYIQSEGNSLIFEAPHDDLGVLFAEAFKKVDGRFIYVESFAELANVLEAMLKKFDYSKVFCAEKNIKSLLQQHNSSIDFFENLALCDVSITTCEYLVARTGSIVLSSQLTNGRTASVYAPIHICIAFANQLVYDIKDALQKLNEKYNNNIPSFISFATGASRTADIEKTLVKGIHGPKEVFCILVEK